MNAYGNEHQKARAQALALLVDGTPCPRCKRPMHHGRSLTMTTLCRCALVALWTGKDSSAMQSVIALLVLLLAIA